MISHDPILVSLREGALEWQMDFVTDFYMLCVPFRLLEVIYSQSLAQIGSPFFMVKVVKLGIRCAKRPSPIQCPFGKLTLPLYQISHVIASSLGALQSAIDEICKKSFKYSARTQNNVFRKCHTQGTELSHYWRIFGRKDPIFFSRTFPNILQFQFLKECPNKLTTIFEQLEIQYITREVRMKKTGSSRRIIRQL